MALRLEVSPPGDFCPVELLNFTASKAHVAALGKQEFPALFCMSHISQSHKSRSLQTMSQLQLHNEIMGLLQCLLHEMVPE